MIGGAAPGFNVNVALGQGEQGVGLSDHDYFYIFNEIVLPIARAWRPQLVLVASGFDACVSDCSLPSGGYSVTPQVTSHCFRRHATRPSTILPPKVEYFFHVCPGVWGYDQSADGRQRELQGGACA